MSKSRRVKNLINSLKQTRDELKVKMHLANAELKEEWRKLEDKYFQMSAQYEPLRKSASQASDEVWESLKLVGEELREGFQNIRKSLKSD